MQNTARHTPVERDALFRGTAERVYGLRWTVPGGRSVAGPRASAWDQPTSWWWAPPLSPTVPSGPAGAGSSRLPGRAAPGTPFTVSVE